MKVKVTPSTKQTLTLGQITQEGFYKWADGCQCLVYIIPDKQLYRNFDGSSFVNSRQFTKFESGDKDLGVVPFIGKIEIEVP